MYINLLIKIKNAASAGKKTVKFYHSNMDKAVLDVLKKHGFIAEVEIKGKNPKKILYVDLKHDKDIHGIKFLSKPSAKLYKGFKDLRKVKGGHGLLVISTPKGIMSGDEARRQKVGGEALFEIW